MTRPRRNKKPRVAQMMESEESEEETEEEEEEAEEVEAPPPSRLTGKRNWNAGHEDLSEDEQEVYDTKFPPLEEILPNMAFCCETCNCSEEQKSRVTEYGDIADSFIQSSLQTLWHRRCCHGLFTYDASQNWISPLEEVNASFWSLEEGQGEGLLSKDDQIPTEQDYAEAVVHERYIRAKRRESQVHNEDGQLHPADQAALNPKYNDMVQAFAILAQIREDTSAPAVVLDMFAGIGTAVVALKRLGIAMSKVSVYFGQLK